MTLLEEIDALLEGKKWEYGKSLAELGENRRQVMIYRAMPASAETIRPDDYITLSLKFAKDHAVTSAVYNGEPFQVATAFVSPHHVVGARNANEYRYKGREPVKVQRAAYIADESGDIRRVKGR